MLDEGMSIPPEGTALMWIDDHAERIDVHRKRIGLGTRGFLVEGFERTAEVTVTRLIGIDTNGDPEEEEGHDAPEPAP